MKFKINKAVFEKFPNLVIALPVITDFDNTKGQAEALAYLRDKEKKLRESMSVESLRTDPRVTSYQDVFREFGVDPNKFKPAHVALASRVLDGKDLPDINPMANLYNAMSIEYLTPYGGEDLETLYGDFELDFANGGEQWIPIGGGKSKPAIKGELIWGDDYDLSTRALNWRQCDRTKLTDSSKNGYFVMDGFSNVNREMIDKASKQFVEMATKLFGGTAKIYWLDKDNTEIEIDFKSKTWDKERIFVAETNQVIIKEKVARTVVQSDLVGMAKEIKNLVDQTLISLDISTVEFSVMHPKEESHGDYSVNVAMILAKQLSQNPRELAAKIVEKVRSEKGEGKSVFEKVEVAGAGFINFYLTKEYLLKELTNATNPSFGKNENLNKQKTYVEFTDPNPFKEFHIGHLMSNTIGEALCRIFEANGAIVKRANYQGDVGLHVAKSIWGLEQKLKMDGKKLSDLQDQALKERIGYLGAAYAYGAGLYETEETAKLEMNALNKEIYEGLAQGTDPARMILAGGVMEFYHTGRAWSLEYFETIYARLGTKFDEYFFESEAGPEGLKVIEEALSKEVLELGEEGAVVFKGEKYGLHTRVFRNKLGLPTYEGKELGLPQMKYGRWAYDKSFIVTANEIDEYFKVLLKVLSLISPELGAKTTHLSHGMMKLTSGKMSSRTGKVVTGEGLLNELKETVLAKMGVREIDNKEIIADQVAVGALKYTVLRQALGGDIVYEPEKMTNLEGNTGPFIQYTYARCSSILRKFQIKNSQILKLETGILLDQEMSVLRWLYRYPEVVSEAGVSYAPHLVSTYIYELASRFNSFYQACRVEENGEVNALRYELTKATANVLKNGLGLLGIQAPAEM